MKKSKLITVVISLLVFSLVGATFVSFSIGSNDRSMSTPFDAMVELGFISDFEREDNVKRIDALQMLLAVTAQRDKSPSNEIENVFTDANQDFVLYAIEQGIVMGNGYSHFSPDRFITLEEMLVMSLRVLGYSDVSYENVYTYAEQAQIYTYTDQDDLYYYLNAGRMAEILWNMLFASPIGEDDNNFSDLLIELGDIDEDIFANICATINYAFGDTTNAPTGACGEYSGSETVTVAPPETEKHPESEETTTTKTETTTQKPGYDDNNGWNSGVFRP